jgi:hypothetical protein
MRVSLAHSKVHECDVTQTRCVNLFTSHVTQTRCVNLFTSHVKHTCGLLAHCKLERA